MDMIRHEAIGPYVKAVFRCKSGEKFQIPCIIALFGEDGLPVISPLRDVVGITNCNGSGYSWHRQINRALSLIKPLRNHTPALQFFLRV